MLFSLSSRSGSPTTADTFLQEIDEGPIDFADSGIHRMPGESV